MCVRGQSPSSGSALGAVDISVIIPALNGAALIGNQLDALAQQETGLRWEVIVADNGSTDATRDIVRQRMSSFPVDLRLVDASRAGVGPARNAGARASRGSRLLFCDCDDEVMPGWLDGAYEALERYDLVGGPNHELREPRDRHSPVVNPATLWGRGEVKSAQGCNFGVRRDSFFLVGGFDESFPPYGCEDVEYAIRLHEVGGTVGPAPSMRIHFRRTTGLVSSLRKVYRSGVAEALVWERHPDRFGSLRGRRAAWRSLLALPWDHTVRALRTRRVDAKGTVRDAVTRWGHVRAYHTILKGGRIPAPQLLSPADDPRAAVSTGHPRTEPTGESE
ncbi:glycosyltransferase family 2 protein [Raineyella sp.]|uniref:glycosyltransferase family 2 protein n=1 Tax=Raineyella sp. TaxID=1911550 RepID=UPI003A52369D